MTSLSIEEYGKYQTTAIQKNPPYLVREFLPLTFFDGQFQTGIQANSELWKFADSQQEFRYEENLSLLAGGFTDDEFELFKRATSSIVEFTSLLSKPIFGRNALTRSFISLRAIEGVAKLLKKPLNELRVLEVGPGSGYLGLICGLMKNGPNYWGLEVTQSLYMYQNQIWHHTFKDMLIEHLESEASKFNHGKEFIHIPWWTWASYDYKLPMFDVLVINHAVNEISPKGFMYLMEKLSSNLDHIHMVVEGWGGGRYHSNLLTLLKKGFHMLHSEHKGGTSYIPISIGKFFKNKVIDFNPNKRMLGIFPRRLTNYLRMLYIKTKFYRLAIIGKDSINFTNPKINIGDQSLENYYSSYAGKASKWTEDEIFGNYIGSSKHLIRD